MRDAGKITITVAEYKRLLAADITLDMLTNRAKMEKYFNKSDILAMMGIPEEEDKDE